MAEQKTVNGVTYTDYNAGAADGINDERLAVLQSIAQHGVRGEEVYEAQRSANEARRQGVIKDMVAEHSAVNASGGLADELARKRAALNSGYDTALSASAAQSAANFNRLSAAEDQYLRMAADSAALNSAELDTDIRNSGSTGGSGGGGGVGGADDGGAGAYDLYDGVPGLTYNDFDALRKAEGLTDAQTAELLAEMRDAGELTDAQWDSWGRAALGSPQSPAYYNKEAPTPRSTEKKTITKSTKSTNKAAQQRIAAGKKLYQDLVDGYNSSNNRRKHEYFQDFMGDEFIGLSINDAFKLIYKDPFKYKARAQYAIERLNKTNRTTKGSGSNNRIFQ